MTPSAGISAADVTVVMPAFNGAATIARALESVRRQTLRPSKVIVVDDGSTDGTADAARSASGDLNVTVLANERSLGSGPSRNSAIMAATTEWIAFLDCDDQWLPGHLAAVVAASQGRVLVTAPALDSDGHPRGNTSGRVQPVTSARCFVPDNIVCTSCTLVRRQAVVDAGLFRPLRRAQDLDLWGRVLEHGAGVALAHYSSIYHLRPVPPNRESNDRDRECVEQVLRANADRPWMTVLVRDGCLGRMEWDDLRLAQREARWSDLVRHMRWFALHPAALPGLVQLFASRRASRRQGAVPALA